MATPPQFPGGFGPEQMQQMQVLMSMMAAGGMNGVPTMPPPMPQPFGTGLPSPPMPGMDPAMAQAYAQVLQQYMQGMSQPAAAFPGAVGALPPPYGGMPQPAALSEPTVSVSVEGMKFQYQLTEDDLHKVFKRYGAVKRVNVDEACSSATVTFHNQQDAQAAINDLDGKVLNGLEGTLRLSWVSQGAAAAPYAAPPMGFPGLTPGLTFPQANPYGAPPVPGAPVLPSTLGGGVGACGSPGGHGAMGDSKPPHVKGAKKYTCRFLIGIENDKEFQVARRLIGSKGANMKRIVRVTEAKLRLRGQGSGYFEGAGQKESSEPLQLCVSCTSQEGYKTAVRQVEELLTRVHEEYRQFCRENNMPVPEDLRINFSENQLVYSRLGGAGGGGTALGDADVPGGGGRSPKRGGAGRGGKKGAGGGGARGGGGGQGDVGEPGPNAPPVEEIQALITERNEARRACNFGEADRIRELLHSRGVALMDEPGGRGEGTEVTTWRYWRD
mmetsp:Transcript_140214/g.364424  ORF Transcript_140214/g.364424 Transcript_140214/m.364424 type:complete len:497 (-) Transcript_140214:141-1631(-)